MRVGGRVWLDGQGWEVVELTGSTVRLIADGRLRTVSVSSLIGNDQVGDDLQVSRTEDLWTVPAVVLAGLSTRQRDALAQKLQALRALVEPEHGDDRNVSERYEATAGELGATVCGNALAILNMNVASVIKNRDHQANAKSGNLRGFSQNVVIHSPAVIAGGLTFKC